MQKREFSVEIGGKTLTATFSDLAELADGSVMLRYGDTLVHATAVMSPEPKNLDYLPLTVDYEERFYAAGQILGSRFIRREGRPSDEAILSGRVVDRTIRPLFDHYIRNDIQVIIMILSLGEHDPDVLAVNAASLALATSSIPWRGPVAAVRIGKGSDAGELVVNPTFAERGIVRPADSGEPLPCLFDLVACGRDGSINMIEVGACEAREEALGEALLVAREELDRLVTWQESIVTEIGKEKQVIPTPEVPPALAALFDAEIAARLDGAVFAGAGKRSIGALGETWKKLALERLPDVAPGLVRDYYDEMVNTIIHREAIERGRRPDGRGLDEIRPLFAQAGGISPLLHGTGIFYRGGTHVLSALTLGGPQDSLIIEGMEVQTKKRFVHHYNFPPFAPGETGRLGGMNRRMIGHGALAEKALAPMIPPREAFPYTIRVVSEVMSSNGSTSMGSVSAATLALMDGGVPIRAPVTGIASGIMYESPERYALLTDIQGPEDEHGDMDFKVAGTNRGVTAVQMDVKVDGIPVPVLMQALEKARIARLKILETITGELAAPRSSLSPHAPMIEMMKIKPEQIGLVIGTGGKVVNEIRELTKTEIEIEDDGSVFITGKNNGPQRAREIIESMTREYLPGDRLQGTVSRIADFGAFVKIGPHSEGLVHVSEIAPWRVESVRDVLSEGQEVPVMVKEPKEGGKISLSIKDADPHFIREPSEDGGSGATRPPRDGFSRRPFSGGRPPERGRDDRRDDRRRW